jgi:hypothetical protein
MAGKMSKWLGPKRRKKEFGSEDGGTPRPGGREQQTRKGTWRNGALVRS